MEASQADMPPLTAFPKSHIVTFKYYLGVIFFLEENYQVVRLRSHVLCGTDVMS